VLRKEEVLRKKRANRSTIIAILEFIRVFADASGFCFFGSLNILTVPEPGMGALSASARVPAGAQPA
jgi:hypothetical protein